MIEGQDFSSYERASDFLNISHVDGVCLQHEFGMIEGPAGSHLLLLLRHLKMPLVTTLHTVLREPNADQRRVMKELMSSLDPFDRDDAARAGFLAGNLSSSTCQD